MSLHNFKGDYQIDKAQFEEVFARMDALEEGNQRAEAPDADGMELELLTQKLEEHRDWVVERMNEEHVQVKEEVN
jgi:hypothetical protein